MDGMNKDKEKITILKNFKFSNYVESEKFVPPKRRENCRNRGPSSGHLFGWGCQN